jgi:hypothetical protein
VSKVPNVEDRAIALMSRQEIDFEFKLFEFLGILGPWTEFEVSIRRLDLPFTEYDNS